MSAGSVRGESGKAFLVERLWPRGVSHEDLPLDGWLKDAAPSTELRRWFGHDPERWAEFQRRYRVELKGEQDAVKELQGLLKQHRTATLLFSSKEERLNNAAALKAYLRK